MQLARFSLHFARNRMTPCVANVHGNHYTSTYLILSRLIPQLPLFGAGILEEKKRARVTYTAHY